MKNIIENATIIYKNGSRELCSAVSITRNGIYTGQIKKANNTNKEFINTGFIPKDQIQKIVFFDIDGINKDIVFNKLKEEKNE